MFGFVFLLLAGGLGFLLIRRGAQPRTVVVTLGTVFVPLSVGVAAWFLASPPIWTLLAPTGSAIVEVADIVPPRDGPPGGYSRSDVIDVRVRLAGQPNGRLLALYGVVPPKGTFASRQEAVVALQAVYPVGETISVRLDSDVAYVDQQDWIATASVLASLLVAILVAIVSLIVVGRRASRDTERPSS